MVDNRRAMGERHETAPVLSRDRPLANPASGLLKFDPGGKRLFGIGLFSAPPQSPRLARGERSAPETHLSSLSRSRALLFG